MVPAQEEEDGDAVNDGVDLNVDCRAVSDGREEDTVAEEEEEGRENQDSEERLRISPG